MHNSMKRIKLLLMAVCLTLGGMRAMAQSNTLRVWMDETLTMTADGATVMYLTVSENDPNATYTSFNMNITLPKGVSVNQVKSGRVYVNDIKMSDRANDQTIECNMPDERTLKIAAFSMTNANLFPDDIDGKPLDALFTVGLKCDPSAINGEYRIELTECVFNAVEGNNVIATHLDHTEYSTLTVSGGTDFAGVDYTLSDLGIGTLTLPCDCTLPTGLAAYTCTGITAEHVLQFDKVAGIEANTPYVVSGTPGDYHFSGTYKALKATYSTEFMTGVIEATTAPVGSYVMQNHAATYGMGFYRVGSVPANMPAYRAYLNALPSAVKMFSLDFGEGTTEIDGIQSVSKETVSVYTLHGLRVKSDVERACALDGLPRGIYIIGGKKYVVTGRNNQ